MRTKNKSLLSLCCLLLITFAACEAKELAISPPYPVIDSGVWADRSSNVYWIDNQRILFITVKDNDKRRFNRGPFNLSVWEIGKGVKPYTDYSQSVTACIQDGMIHRTQKDEQGNVQRFYGKFGEEKTFELPKVKGAYFDFINCRPITNPDILAKRQNNRAITPLLDRHGYLDKGAIHGKESLKETPAVLYRPGDNEGIIITDPYRGARKLLCFQRRLFYYKRARALSGLRQTWNGVVVSS